MGAKEFPPAESNSDRWIWKRTLSQLRQLVLANGHDLFAEGFLTEQSRGVDNGTFSKEGANFEFLSTHSYIKIGKFCFCFVAYIENLTIAL